MTEGEKPGVAEPVPAPPPIQPLVVTMIGTRTAGTGVPIVDGQVIITPDHQPNVVARVIPPVVALAVRAVRTFIDALLGGLGLVGGGTLTGTLPWATWRVALLFAGSVTIVSILRNLGTIFSDLEKDHPLLTGSV